MDIKIFAGILRDKSFPEYKKLKYKYKEDFESFLKILDEWYYKELPLSDFNGKKLAYFEERIFVNKNAVKILLQSQERFYGIKAAEDEIIATSAIESIDFSRDSVRSILKGAAPSDEEESRILGIKKGIDFITNYNNKITEENIYKLYMMVVGDFLEEDERLSEGKYYRHDDVFVVSDRVEHSGLDHKKLPEFMKKLVDFINTEDETEDLIKGAIVHFYVAYIHPYFDGNGRMARLLHLWFLIQKGYQSALFIPFSSSIEKSRKAYYEAFTTVEENSKYSGRIDVTPFLIYFVNNVYNRMEELSVKADTMTVFNTALKESSITAKEEKLWKFVISYYGTDPFSTKQLEKDFGDAAYATIRSFVLKFEQLGLLTSVRYGTRVKYSVVK